jgi:heptosyltransferase-2
MWGLQPRISILLLSATLSVAKGNKINLRGCKPRRAQKVSPMSITGNMKKTLLIKTGAAGDVVRTTTLLNVLEGAVTWVIDHRYAALLPGDHPALARIIALEEAAALLKNKSFDLVLSLEEDPVCAALATAVTAHKLIGVYAHETGITYTDEVAGWFDMSLVSKLGRKAANEAKAANTHTFQHWLFQMLSLSFQGEPYRIYHPENIRPQKGLIGIETRCGNRWPNKAWGGYQALAERLTGEGYTCMFLSQRKELRDYLDDIARCSYLISGDTLAMHVALAYEIPVLAIFNCTSPVEIYDYHLLEKVVSPLLKEAFYGRDYSTAVISSVTVKEVYNTFKKHHVLKEKA